MFIHLYWAQASQIKYLKHSYLVVRLNVNIQLMLTCLWELRNYFEYQARLEELWMMRLTGTVNYMIYQLMKRKALGSKLISF